ncbi:hypothetical protein GCM10022245_28050 [Streptomyces mayteni]
MEGIPTLYLMTRHPRSDTVRTVCDDAPGPPPERRDPEGGAGLPARHHASGCVTRPVRTLRTLDPLTGSQPGPCLGFL